MSNTASSGMIAGLFRAWIAFRDTNGYPIGTSPTTPANNTTTSAYLLKYPVSYTAPQITRAVATRKGGQSIRGKRVLGIDQIGDFQITLDGFDEQFNAYITSTTFNTTPSVCVNAFNANLVTLPKFYMGIGVGYNDENGNAYYSTLVFENVQITPIIPSGTQQGGDNPNALTYTITPDVSSRTITGMLHSVALPLVQDNSDIFTSYVYPYIYFPTTYVADGIATTFTLPYKPVSSDATGAGAPNYNTKNGVVTPATSVNTTTGVVTLAAAGSAADIHVAFVPTAFA